MRKAKRFNTEEDILKEIDCQRRAINWNNEEAEILNRWADILREYPGRSIELLKLRERANKHTKRANSIQDRKLAHLSAALAEFRTTPIPGVLTDSSVAA